jgi:hypothetical protein
MREWLTYGAIDDNAQLINDLTGPEYEINTKGQLRLETKDSMKKRGIDSPDDGDALALTFAEPVARRDSRTFRGVRQGTQFAQTDYDIFSNREDYHGWSVQ